MKASKVRKCEDVKRGRWGNGKGGEEINYCKNANSSECKEENVKVKIDGGGGAWVRCFLEMS